MRRRGEPGFRLPGLALTPMSVHDGFSEELAALGCVDMGVNARAQERRCRAALFDAMVVEMDQTIEERLDQRIREALDETLQGDSALQVRPIADLGAQGFPIEGGTHAVLGAELFNATLQEPESTARFG